MSTDSSYYGNGCWYSRSPDADYSRYARCVIFDGTLGSNDVNVANYGLRPSFTVSIG
jgi:hypothetical protein